MTVKIYPLTLVFQGVSITGISSMTILAEFIEDIGLYKTMNKKTADRCVIA